MEDTLRDWIIQKVAEQLPEAEKECAERLTDQAISYFLDQTMRKNVPARAGWLLVEIALLMHKEQTSGSANIASVKRGDTTIQYRDDTKRVMGLSSADDRIALYRVARAR